MNNEKPTLLEKLNYCFGMNINDISKINNNEIKEYNEKNPIKIL